MLFFLAAVVNCVDRCGYTGQERSNCREELEEVTYSHLLVFSGRKVFPFDASNYAPLPVLCLVFVCGISGVFHAFEACGVFVEARVAVILHTTPWELCTPQGYENGPPPHCEGRRLAPAVGLEPTTVRLSQFRTDLRLTRTCN